MPTLTQTASPLDATKGGVIAASVTPLRVDGGIDIVRLADHCRWLIRHGCDGVSTFGSTGEGNSCSIGEKIDVLHGLAEAGLGPRLVPGTGCCALSDSIELTRAAVEIDAPAVLMLPPFYYKDVNATGLAAFFSDVIEAVGDAKLKILLYHIPGIAGVSITPELIELLFRRYPQTVVGMKDSSGDFAAAAELVARFPGFAVYTGADDYLLPLLDAGGVGAITAGANLLAPLLGGIFKDRHKAGVERDQVVIEMVWRHTLLTFPLVAALKAAVARNTRHEGWNRARPPLECLSAEQASALFAQLDGSGLTLPPA